MDQNWIEPIWWTTWKNISTDFVWTTCVLTISDMDTVRSPSLLSTSRTLEVFFRLVWAVKQACSSSCRAWKSLEKLLKVNRQKCGSTMWCQQRRSYSTLCQFHQQPPMAHCSSTNASGGTHELLFTSFTLHVWFVALNAIGTSFPYCQFSIVNAKWNQNILGKFNST